MANADLNQQSPAPLADVADYYTDTLNRHGPSARGVDWNGEESQNLRFTQLARLINTSAADAFSVNDLGCGYGALLNFLIAQYPAVRYQGYDISAKMIEAAQTRHASAGAARFFHASKPGQRADYSFASGIFNVRLDHPDSEWRDHVLQTLDVLDRSSSRGFAFNCLTSYSDSGKMRPYLYYADPCDLFAHCKRAYARDVALLHDYGLYEFTLLVRKTL
ncbi:class I SAM-dependent methyltransferase [Candidatus Methylospira mobilis]|uniref:class I SAM-dependent methyltransferase n=1 Tax=Candidatus Methylospira mobilis TaxID=1808979 RepID=UPI0028EFB602|nr:class I SAM-dependent methyltransferase [Candidatus Methylospira mobilis]WNV05379.1 class I SAM-dependent methyltransferase [Candidatus Methylospira mobilis]